MGVKNRILGGSNGYLGEDISWSVSLQVSVHNLANGRKNTSISVKCKKKMHLSGTLISKEKSPPSYGVSVPPTISVNQRTWSDGWNKYLAEHKRSLCYFKCQSFDTGNTYAPGGRLSSPRSASMLSLEVAQCSASEVHALNGKPSALCWAESGDILIIMHLLV